MKEETKTFVIEENIEGLRLDKALTILDKNNSRVYYGNLIKNGDILVNGKVVSPSYKVKKGDKIEVFFRKKESNLDLEPLELELDIVYEDDDILVINKPQGLVVHPGDGHHNDTLVNALIYNQKELSTMNGLDRVGIVHRIDKDTSGLLLICKNDEAHNFIAEQLKDHSMHREYIALVDGNLQSDSGKIVGKIGRDKGNRQKMAIDNINGKDAITHFEVIERFKNFTLIKCRLETGRTHQIRVHMSSIGHPVTGDKLYGGNCSFYQNGQLLHAYKLTFVHPRTKKEMTLECPLPEYFTKIIERLRELENR